MGTAQSPVAPVEPWQDLATVEQCGLGIRRSPTASLGARWTRSSLWTLSRGRPVSGVALSVWYSALLPQLGSGAAIGWETADSARFRAQPRP